MANGDTTLRAAPAFPLTAAAIAAVNALLVTVTTFGVDLSLQQENAITSLTNAAVILVLALSHAYRSSKFNQRLDKQNGRVAELEQNGHADAPPPSPGAPAAG